MINKQLDQEFEKIARPILNNSDFNTLKNIKHHDNNRFNHCLKVSYYSYKLAKYLRLDYEGAARAGLLHDFYFEQVSNQANIKDKILLFTSKHPNEALNNATKYFELSDKEEDIIRTHMFPINIRVPKYAESWIVSMIDKGVSVAEFRKKFSCHFAYVSNILVILLLNLLNR